MRITNRGLAAIVVLLILNSCFLAPAIHSFKKIGATAGDRQVLLGERLKAFSEALYWGEPDHAVAFAVPESREAILLGVKKFSREERVVDSKVDSVEFSDDAFDATAQIIVKSFRVPFYVVVEKLEEQKWTFSVANGWRIVSREIIKTY